MEAVEGVSANGCAPTTPCTGELDFAGRPAGLPDRSSGAMNMPLNCEWFAFNVQEELSLLLG